MMYSFTAIEAIDTLNDHGGFHFFLVIAIAILVLVISVADDAVDIKVTSLVLGVFVAVVGAISYNTGEVKVFANKQVEATQVGFQAEGYNIAERNGKSTRQVDKHEQFVVYAVPEGNVMFPAKLGQTYPQKAILYKN